MEGAGELRIRHLRAALGPYMSAGKNTVQRCSVSHLFSAAAPAFGYGSMSMDDIFDLANYQLHWVSVPFAIAAAIFLLACLHVLVMRGAAVLRAAWLLVAIGFLPYLLGGAAVASAENATVALQLLRFAVAGVPIASAGVLIFFLALAERLEQQWLLIAVALATSLVIAVLTVATPLIVPAIRELPSGIPWIRAQASSFLHSLVMVTWLCWGLWIGWRQLHRERSALRRRQVRGGLVAFGIIALGGVDIPLGFGVGYFPVSGLLTTAGLLLALRALFVEDLMRASAVDRRVPLAGSYLVIAGLTLHAIASVVGVGPSELLLAAAMLGAFVILRVLSLAFAAISGRRRDGAQTALERVAEQYGARVQELTKVEEIASATEEAVRVGIGAEVVELVVPRVSDYAWTRSSGELLSEEQTPDPLLLGWFLEHRRPMRRDDLTGARLADLREPLERLFEVHAAEVLTPLISRDELVGLIVVGAARDGRAYPGGALEFLSRLHEAATAALVYARMLDEALRRVEVDKEVELAAAVQAAFIPAGDDLSVGPLHVSGLYAPATQCGGDWWSVHHVPDGRVLVLVGDVTGHGVAAAMITAAAKGCYDVAERLMGCDIDVVELLMLLDAAVRRVGANHFNMTCFATLIDAAQGQVTYANAGHVVPYVCRTSASGRTRLEVLQARGNPLGAAASASSYRAESRAIRPGDIIIWYTDGIVECSNGQREQFGDRRMQRLLREMDLRSARPRQVRDHLLRSVLAFQDGVPVDDDITLVVGRLAQ